MITPTDSDITLPRPFRIALIGNPNTGKSTLFNALSGMRVRTGNYPGVTVEQRTARVCWNNVQLELSDLPGTYSLAPRSPDEMVAVTVLTGCGNELPPDLVICICNASALERNLYLVTQVLETGLPVVLCLNMWDSTTAAGVQIDIRKLSQELGVPVVTTSASRREGLDELRSVVLTRLTEQPDTSKRQDGEFTDRVLNSAVHVEITRLSRWLSNAGVSEEKRTWYLVSRSLLDPDGSVENLLVRIGGAGYLQELQASRQTLADRGFEIPASEARERYQFAGALLSRIQRRVAGREISRTDRIDAVLIHRFWGLIVCLSVLLMVFSSIYWFSAPLSNGVTSVLEWVSEQVVASMAPGPFRGLLTEGVISGVGSVLVFLPQICLLFLFISILEDSGYMARAAFMMDRLMSVLGLSGRSFLPLMSSFACAVPGIMATRVIEDRRDRFVTILIAPLMSCSARLPVYILMIGTFIPQKSYLGGLISLQAVVLFAMSTLGLVVAVPVAMVLRRTFFRGEASPFLLELPDYRIPSPRVVILRVWESARSFVVRAGTLIFATSVVIWALGSWPGDQRPHYELLAKLEAMDAEREATGQEADAGGVSEDEEAPERTALIHQLNEVRSDLLTGSVLGRMGRFVEPVVKPVGWDWRIGVGVIASFPAREVVIATLGTIYSLGGDVDEEHDGLRGTLRAAAWPDGRPVFTIPVALSIMVFFALCAQCVSTLMVIRRETNSWRWPLFSFVYMTVLAWLGAYLTYQTGSFFSA